MKTSNLSVVTTLMREYLIDNGVFYPAHKQWFLDRVCKTFGCSIHSSYYYYFYLSQIRLEREGYEVVSVRRRRYSG